VGNHIKITHTGYKPEIRPTTKSQMTMLRHGYEHVYLICD